MAISAGKGNSNLNQAKAAQKDEFYTTYESISREVERYSKQLKGKRIICPCDWDESLDEVLVYASEDYVSGHDLFNPGGSVKIIDNAHVNSHIIADIREVKCSFVKFLIAHAEAYGIESIAVSGYNPATGEGVRFQDINYSNYDVVITNPPFSQFREFVDVMFANNMDFLVVAPQNAITYANVFPHIKANEMWLGYHSGDMQFRVPDDYEERSTRFWIDESGQRWRSLGNACWFTTLTADYRNDELILTEEYSPERYPQYINYDAIDVGKVSEIPYDYAGEMGVPITFLQKYNPNQFEIIGISSELALPMSECAEPGAKYEKGGPRFYTTKLTDKDISRGNAYHREFDRIVIRNRKPYIEEDHGE